MHICTYFIFIYVCICIHGGREGWMDGWIDGWMDECIDVDSICIEPPIILMNLIDSILYAFDSKQLKKKEKSQESNTVSI